MCCRHPQALNEGCYTLDNTRMAVSNRRAASARLPYDTNLLAPAPGRPRLPITDQVVQDILFAQPRGQLPAADLAELFGAKSGAEREHLLKVVARVGELSYRQNGVPMVRLKKPLGAGRPKRAERSGAPAGMAPLPIEAIEVRRVLLVQRGHQMEVDRLRALFAPRGEAQRHALTVAISNVAEIVRPAEVAAAVPVGGDPWHPPVVVRLKKPDWVARRGGGEKHAGGGNDDDAGGGDGPATGGGVAGGGSDVSVGSDTPAWLTDAAQVLKEPALESSSAEKELAAPVTSVERELIENLLRRCPGARMEADEMVRLLAPSGEKARLRRINHV